MDEKLKEYLLSLETVLDFNKLIKFVEASEIEIEEVNLRFGIAFASLDKIYMSIEQMSSLSPRQNYYVMLHEMCHMKMIKKVGRKEVINRLSNTDKESFLDYIVYEEILADRYASAIFYKLTGVMLKKYETQNLEDKENSARYKEQIEFMYGQIENNEESYYKLVNKMLN